MPLNNWVQAAPVFAFLFILSRVPGAPEHERYCDMKPTKTDSKSQSRRYVPAILLLGVLLFGLPGCGTFSGMSSEERDRANEDLAKESKYLPALKPERSLQDNREVRPYVP